MKQLALVIISSICNWLLRRVFFIHGSYIAWTRRELTEYWKSISIVNDVRLNVLGKYLLNQRLSTNGAFGNRLMTISAAFYLDKQERAASKWYKFLNRVDKDHVLKAYESHKKNIINEYNNLTNGKV